MCGLTKQDGWKRREEGFLTDDHLQNGLEVSKELVPVVSINAAEVFNFTLSEQLLAKYYHV